MSSSPLAISLSLFLAVCLLSPKFVCCQSEEVEEVEEADLIVRHPYMVNVRGFGSFACSGALLGEFTVVTAAQCVDPRDGRENRPLLWLNTTRSEELTPGSMVRQTVETVFHPNYTGNAVDGYNMAILRLNESAAPLRTLRPLFIGAADTLLGRSLFVLSFGRTSLAGARTQTLQIGEVNVVDPQQCINANIGYIEEQMFCVDRAVPCSGDLGGPVFSGTTVRAEFFFGLVSGTACFENIELSGIPNAATDETISWLESTIDSVEARALEALGIPGEEPTSAPVIVEPPIIPESAPAPEIEDYYDMLDIQLDE